jgi:hypothetical protein
LRSFAGPRGFKQNISQPGCVAALEPKRVTEYSSLVSATRVRWAQAIILKLADIEDCLIPMRQKRHAHGILLRQCELRRIISLPVVVVRALRELHRNAL